MERCPNCGAPARPGAKFCTTCGYRFDDDDRAIEMTDTPAPERTASGPTASGPTGATNDQSSGDWASYAPSGWNAAQSWAPPPPPPATPTNEEAATGAAATWQQRAAAGWPTPRAEEDIIAVSETQETVALVDEQPEATEPTQNPALIEAIQRADRLLDELRSTVATIGRTQAPDLSGVISELEVALTPPAALQADDLAALRETLHTAGERPRDIDTILDLTGKLSALSALMIAYDRSIAAIERSLDTLRGAASSDHPGWEH